MQFPFRRRQKPSPAGVVQTAPASPSFWPVSGLGGLDAQCRLYDCLRQNVPLIDAAIGKLVRLTMGDVRLRLQSKQLEEELAVFLQSIPVAGGGYGLSEFLSRYLDSLLTYGNAAGEIVADPKSGAICGLYHAPLSDIEVRKGDSPMELRCYSRREGCPLSPVPFPHLILFSPLNPRPSEILGRSLLASLPFVSQVLMKIYEATRQNFDRVGNVRFAVTYHPGDSAIDRSYAKDMAQSIADEWRGAMNTSDGQVKDFVCVGDVDIKVIGADNQVLDILTPARQMEEQMVAKLGIPPFLLGLQWSTTERMSAQQADILTSELDYYRSILNAVITKIARVWLAIRGVDDTPRVEWESVNLQDEVEAAKARLYRAQARQAEALCPQDDKEVIV